MGEQRKSVQGFGGKTRRKETTGKTEAWMGDGIRMGLREIVWGYVEWIQLAKDRDRWLDFVGAVMNLRILESRS
jgi:hypothetical protein